MKYTQRIAGTFISFIRILLTLVALVALVFVVKWRINVLFDRNISKQAETKTISQEFQDSYEQINDITETAKHIKDNEVVVTIPANPSVDTIGDVLLSLDLIEHKPTFEANVKESGRGSYFTQGEFVINKDATTAEIINTLTQPGYDAAKRTVHIVIEPGANGTDVARMLKHHDLIEDENAFVGMMNHRNVFDLMVPGEYDIEAPIKNLDLLNIITNNQASQEVEGQE